MDKGWSWFVDGLICCNFLSDDVCLPILGLCIYTMKKSPSTIVQVSLKILLPKSDFHLQNKVFNTPRLSNPFIFCPPLVLKVVLDNVAVEHTCQGWAPHAFFCPSLFILLPMKQMQPLRRHVGGCSDGQHAGGPAIWGLSEAIPTWGYTYTAGPTSPN